MNETLLRRALADVQAELDTVEMKAGAAALSLLHPAIQANISNPEGEPAWLVLSNLMYQLERAVRGATLKRSAEALRTACRFTRDTEPYVTPENSHAADISARGSGLRDQWGDAADDLDALATEIAGEEEMPEVDLEKYLADRYGEADGPSDR